MRTRPTLRTAPLPRRLHRPPLLRIGHGGRSCPPTDVIRGSARIPVAAPSPLSGKLPIINSGLAPCRCATSPEGMAVFRLLRWRSHSQGCAPHTSLLLPKPYPGVSSMRRAPGQPSRGLQVAKSFPSRTVWCISPCLYAVCQIARGSSFIKIRPSPSSAAGVA